VRINEELLERKVAAPVYKTAINDRGGSAATPLFPQKLALNVIKTKLSVTPIKLFIVDEHIILVY
jgi:hypothetical protein